MESIEAGHFYHIYNRGNNKDPIFKDDADHKHFLYLVAKHLLPKANVYAYALLSNHFHLLVQIREDAEKPSQAFSNLFNAYAKGFNKKHNRVGSLLQRPFRRIKVKDENYLKRLIIYIHRNPESHGFTTDFKKYGYTSYGSIISTMPTKLERYKTIELFETIENFIISHKNTVEIVDYN